MLTLRSTLRGALGASMLGLFTTTAFTATTTSGCGAFSGCEAVCDSDVAASGPFVPPAGATRLDVKLCLDGDCAAVTLSPIGDSPSADVEYRGTANTLTASVSEGQLDVLLREERYGEEDEDEKVTVQVVVTDQDGATVLDETSAVIVREDELCDSTCWDVIATWN